ncbi:DMT family transporter [Bifidobacterium platyrrhinorum]|uniref:EamA family transporter n=1 Tax=Bifidobacterium platyrrhinorum TaxID=2661628 RepID=A0A6L9SPJ4_9BIFI|nr:DMT family transporter [Bifidobacterium platyrrhinorum]NEG54447.1 EamA family transporter [Bifidobacterium platyrrhinorum]
MLCLVTCALIWGFAFVAQVQGMDAVTPLFFNAARFTLGAVSLLPILAVRRARRARKPRRESSGASDAPVPAGGPGRSRIPSGALGALVVGVICGTVLFAASTLQQYGILYGKSAGRAGFLTALYIVMVPLLAFAFLHRRIGPLVGVAVVLAVAGFYLLCVTDGFGSIGAADLLLLFTAVLFAVHILVIDTLGAKVDAIALSFVQFCTTAVLSWAGSVMEGSIDFSGAAAAWEPIVYAGIGSVGIAYTLQVVGQQWVPPTRASLLMSLESFFSAVGGAVFLGEMMTPRGYLGCALIFVGTLLAQAPARLPRVMRRDRGSDADA